MGTYVNKTIRGVSYESLFDDCCVILEEPHKAGDILRDRIILSESIWFGETVPSEEELENNIYDKGYAVRAVKINLIDDIKTHTDMTPYGFTKVDEDRYCKSEEAIGWARMEVYARKQPMHKPEKRDMVFWIE